MTSISQTNVSLPEFNQVLMNRLTTQLDELHSFGARSFLFLTVPPIDRSPLFIQQGRAVTSLLASDIANYNSHLSATVKRFQTKHRDLDQVTLFDTQPVFNKLLDNAKM
jgi:phospholipase/lecithinase/hemolysin